MCFKIIAIDFDGTLCENKRLEIGELISNVINMCYNKIVVFHLKIFIFLIIILYISQIR